MNEKARRLPTAPRPLGATSSWMNSLQTEPLGTWKSISMAASPDTKAAVYFALEALWGIARDVGIQAKAGKFDPDQLDQDWIMAPRTNLEVPWKAQAMCRLCRPGPTTRPHMGKNDLRR